MANLTNDAENALLDLLFTNVAWANIGDASGLQPSAADGNFWISLHTADPTDTGSVTNEATYTSYARVAIVRTTSGWTVTSDVVDNDANITFPAATGGSNTLTHFGIHSAVSGAGNMIIHGALGSSLPVSSGITPQIDAGDLDITAA